MTKKQQIKLFEDKKVRVAWDDELQEWFFSVVDAVEVLTDSKDPKDYLKKMRKREPELDAYVGTNCPLVSMLTPTGKHRKTLAANAEHLFRIIQSIPSKKAEPFKRWMAEVAAQRLEQMQDPELSINQAVADWRRLGYSESWINNRIKSIEVRKGLTDEWDRAGVQQGQQYASLTDIITREWSGKTTRQYKQFKGLKKESLRDNMTNTELILNMLAESAATDLSREQNPKGFTQSAKIAKKGGSVAKAARQKLESQLGHSVISPAKAADYLPPAQGPELLEGGEENDDNK